MAELSSLVRLQEIDLELLRSMKAVEDLPQKEKIQRLRRATKKAQSELAHITGKRKDLEMTIEENDEAQLEASAAVDEAQAKAEESDQSYRDLKNLEAQLTSLAKRLEKLAFDRDQMEAELNSVKAQEAEKAQWIQRASDEEQAQLNSYKADLDALGATVSSLKKERASLVEDLDSALLARYDAAYKRFNGLAVETLAGNKPSVCRVSLQPGQLAHLDKDSINECPYCHRILVCS